MISIFLFENQDPISLLVIFQYVKYLKKKFCGYISLNL